MVFRTASLSMNQALGQMWLEKKQSGRNLMCTKYFLVKLFIIKMHWI